MKRGSHRRSWWEKEGFGCCGRLERHERVAAKLINLACEQMLAKRAGITVAELRRRNDWR